jgi:hypothetical protein
MATKKQGEKLPNKKLESDLDAELLKELGGIRGAESNNISASSRTLWWDRAVIAINDSVDDIEATYGPTLYDEMMTDPTAQGVVNALVALVQQCRPDLKASHENNAYAKMSDVQREEAEASQEILKFCVYSLERLGQNCNSSATTLMREMVERAVTHGHCLAEIIYEFMETGLYAGKLVLRSIVPKPRERYVHLVDQQNGLIGVQAIIPGKNYAIWNGVWDKSTITGIPGFLPKSKVFNFAFWSKNGSPIGRSLLRGAYRPWIKRKMGDTEDLNTAMSFGGGQWSAEADVKVRATDQGTKDLETSVKRMSNSGTMVLPPGYTLKRHNPAQVDFFQGFLQRCRTDITEGIFGAARAFIESKSGSKADSQTAQDISLIVAEVIADAYGESLRSQILYPLVQLNFGIDAADKFTPQVILNHPTTQDIPRMAEALAHLMSSSALPKNMLSQAVEKWLGLTWQEPDDWDTAFLTPGKQAKQPGGIDKRDL